MTTEAIIRDELRAYVAQFPTQYAAAASMGVSSAFVSRILNGRRPHGKVLDALGYARQPMGRGIKSACFTRLSAYDAGDSRPATVLPTPRGPDHEREVTR